MITLRITRTEDDGRETELGEVRMLDGRVFSTASTPEGMHVVPQISGALSVAHGREDGCRCRYTVDGHRAVAIGCPYHSGDLQRRFRARRFDA